MTSRERLLAVLGGELPDCVPVCPDISNMVPCRLTGKPFWDIYAFKDPPLWKAHIDALKYFDIDGGFELYDFGPEDPLTGDRSPWSEYIVKKDDERFITRDYREDRGVWSDHVRVYTAGNPPATGVRPEQLGLPAVPRDPVPLEGAKEWPMGMERWLLIREELGDQGVLGLQSGMGTSMMGSVEQIYAYHDDPKPFFERAEEITASVERRMDIIAGLEVKPDFLLCGGSGSLVFQSPQVFRELVLPVLKRTTEVMLFGTEDDVARACREAIDQAGSGGNFILSTGDQCGRDTPDANIRSMVDTARTYGKY